MVRRVLVALLALGPLTVALDRTGASDLVLFALASASLVPLAWAIGEATEQAAHHVGPGVGGFLNATFGNAPELIVSLVAVSDGLTDVVRASLAGSVVGNLMLVLGFSLALGRRSAVDRTSAALALSVVALAAVALAVPTALGLGRDPDRRALAYVALPFAVGLLTVRVFVNRFALRRQRALFAAADTEPSDGWPMSTAMVALAAATLVTAFVTEVLVGSLETFAKDAHLSEFFVAFVIVAIVGNAAEHGSAVLLARRGQMRLATEISLASSAQVAGTLIPLVVLLSWLIDPLTLSFRVIEVGAMLGAAALAALVLARGESSRAGGVLLLSAYVALAVAAYFTGDR